MLRNKYIQCKHLIFHGRSILWMEVVGYHKDRFWVLFFLQFNYCLLVSPLDGLKFLMYADDCQLFTWFSMSANDAVSSLQMAINCIRAWYAANMLKLNDDITEMLVIGSKYLTIPKLPDLNMGSTVITPGEHVRNLGVIMDTKFTMEPHINKTMQIGFENSPNFLLSKTFDTICC